jgi:Mrp family chromosome partitioning ATPase
MREVDEALSRAFARRAIAPAHTGVPPAPHWASKAVETSRQGASDPRRQDERSAETVGRADLPRQPSAIVRATDPSETLRWADTAVELQWPELVLMLERQWGHRFEELADALIEIRDRQHVRVLLFTSCHRAEGRTTLILALARALARRPIRTILVDADLTGPMLARSIGLHPPIGFEDVIEQDLALADAVVEAADDHLWLLPLRAAVAQPREFLAAPGWSRAMARLRREFDLVLVDSSPMFTGLNASVPHHTVDAAILVHNKDATGDRALRRAEQALQAAGIPLLGLAETFA